MFHNESIFRIELNGKSWENVSRTHIKKNMELGMEAIPKSANKQQ